MQNNTVLILGAGFSAPAKLPIQNKIIREMLEPPTKDFMTTDSLLFVSKNFLLAYVDVGIFLIDNYTCLNSNEIKNKRNKILFDQQNLTAVHDFLKSVSKMPKIRKELSKTKYINDIFNGSLERGPVELANDAIKELTNLKELVRNTLNSEVVDVDLEDLFTKLDKSVNERKNWKNYSYSELDYLKQSLLKLFVYYFSNKNSSFNIDESYSAFAAFLEKHSTNTSVITTNWDTICEQIAIKKSIDYDLCFNDIHYFQDNIARKKKKLMKIAKVHGSINWFSCLNCGSVVAKSKLDSSSFLFEDKNKKCITCKSEQEKHPLFIPEIITPTMVKSINKQIYSNIWQSAEYLLKDAKRVVFVGYSFPLADFELRFLLTKFIDSEAEIDVILYTDDKPVNNNQECPQKRYERVFSKNEIRFHYEGFKIFFEKMNCNL